MKIKMLSNDTRLIPSFSSDFAAGLDLKADVNSYWIEKTIRQWFADKTSKTQFTLNSGERILIKCGFAVEIPHGYVGLVCPRSGMALDYGVTVLNAPGIIDSDYRGEMGVILINLGQAVKVIDHGDKIAQLVVVTLGSYSQYDMKQQLEFVEELSDTERGEKGFGSSGK